MKTNLTIWMLDHPFFHGLATDPRASVQELYYSDQMNFYSLSDLARIAKLNQARVHDTSLYYRQITIEILEGKSPSARLLDEPITLMARGHHLRINDILSKTVNTLLARIMDSGLVAKISSKYYMTDGKIFQISDN